MRTATSSAPSTVGMPTRRLPGAAPPDSVARAQHNRSWIERGGERMKARRGSALVLTGLALVATSAVVPASLADPAFGPGNKGGGVGNSGPQVGKCHPPGQTT